MIQQESRRQKSRIATILVLAAGVFVNVPGSSLAEPFYLQQPAFPVSNLHVTIVEKQEGPVLRTSPAGLWDSVDLLNPSVILRQGKYWNFYSGFDGKLWHTGVATSTDGIKWQKSDRNPVLSPRENSWDQRYIAANGSAIVINDRVHYYYQGMTADHVTQIGLATSPDGLAFQPGTVPVLIPGPIGAWDESAVADPYVISYQGTYYMYFLGMNRGGMQRLGVARSEDGLKWTKHPGNPILDIGATGDFDSRGLGEPSVVSLGNVFLMLYTGRDDLERRGLGLALSFDGINWRRQSGKALPLKRRGWSSEVMCDSTLLLSDDGKTLRVWFGGGDKRQPGKNLNGQVGLFELALPEWAYAGFDAKAKWSGTVASTEVLKGSYPIEGDGTCWIGQEASISLKPPFKNGIEITGYAPVSVHRKGKSDLKELTIGFFLDGRMLHKERLTDDNAFNVTVPVAPEFRNRVAQLTIRVSDVFNASKAGIGADQRDLGVIVSRITPN